MLRDIQELAVTCANQSNYFSIENTEKGLSKSQLRNTFQRCQIVTFSHYETTIEMFVWQKALFESNRANAIRLACFTNYKMANQKKGPIINRTVDLTQSNDHK